jgi:hypothetical protein
MVLGFSNNETNKIRLNGYADIKLENILVLVNYYQYIGKATEMIKRLLTQYRITIFTKITTRTKAQIQLFRQDSTFQNTKQLLI